MDSVTQAALGAAVAVAVMGKSTPVKKAALWGAVAGTLPDLDVFIHYGDDLSNMLRHRGESHAIFYQTLFSPLLAWLICRWHQQQALFLRWWLAIWLVLVTHSLLDTFTTYGTQLALPFSNYPFALESIFVIDPLYTLPLLIGVGLAWRLPGSGLGFNKLGLLLSSLYLGWGLLAQQWVLWQLDQQHPELAHYERLVQPTALNTLVWRVIVMDAEGYREGFYALNDGKTLIEFRQHAFPEQAKALSQLPAAQELTRFSHGFIGYFQRSQLLTMADLRMGMQGNYAFEFSLACQQGTELKPIAVVQLDKPYQMLEIWAWAFRRFWLEARPLSEITVRSQPDCD
ncbi:metal-dependent hydrolase [Alkalimonas sp.]|uniref:metal-dependent hydrolase n=1 Tax=Alkalimonas sp. TaxID=1872453 RepID=UPI00263BAE5E|nr:metal-dependent hydrolase [Alkalimonas sp.]MCC5826436.1 metal-dependent hydrolase [Alkalimonas sp.]